jgi:hypothetical protein
MSPARDYYEILRVSPDAPASRIEESYRALLAHAGAAHAALLAEAYAVLSVAHKRAAYDLAREVEASPDDYAATAVLDPQAERFAAHRCLFCGTPHGLDRALGHDDDCAACASPLYPAARHRFEPSGQRMLNRIEKRRAVDLYVSWPQSRPYEAEMRDLSLNGMQIAASSRLSANQIVKIDGDVCAAVARVAHCEREHDAGSGAPRRWLIGVEFLTVRFRSPRGSFVSAHA